MTDRTPGRDYVKDAPDLRLWLSACGWLSIWLLSAAFGFRRAKEQTSQLLTSRGGLGETLYNTLRPLFKRCRIQAPLAHIVLVRLCHIRIWLSACGCQSGCTNHSCKTLSHSLVADRLWLSIWLHESIQPVRVGGKREKMSLLRSRGESCEGCLGGVCRGRVSTTRTLGV